MILFYESVLTVFYQNCSSTAVLLQFVDDTKNLQEVSSKFISWLGSHLLKSWFQTFHIVLGHEQTVFLAQSQENKQHSQITHYQSWVYTKQMQEYQAIMSTQKYQLKNHNIILTM